MPANLTPMYREAEKRFKEAATQEEKIEALEDMIRLLPKHKGTDHLFADLKRRLSKLKSGTGQKKGGQARRKSPYHIPTSGAGQVVLIGLPNAGKSAILKALTNKDVEVAPYPYTTHVPTPAMMLFENAQVQLIDTPPLTPDSVDPELVVLLKNVDICILVVDLSDDDVLEVMETLVGLLEERRLQPVPCGYQDKEEEPERIHLKTILAGTRLDQDVGKYNLNLLREFFDGRFEILALSPETGEGVEAFRKNLWDALGIIRIYTQAPGKKVNKKEPMYLQRGGTVLEFAGKVHRDFVDNLKYARVWGSALYDGQHVKINHVLEDEDVIELGM